MPKLSAGLLMFRRKKGRTEVLLVHPGGPLWKNKDEGAWSVPKGVVEEDEDILEAAKREFQEETGIEIKADEFFPLGSVRLKSGKVVYAWAFEGDCDTSKIKSNTFTMEWPPRSGKRMEFPEIDRAEWFDLDTARKKINPAQSQFIRELERVLNS
ncbi:MAG: NUDIX domain-containing protein [Nitrospirae bacterium]|nr:NUDIX domain-containing protein [Nitrospirota bacterium]